MRIEVAAGTMNHVGLDGLEQCRLRDGVRPRRAYSRVNSGSIEELIAAVEEDEEVHVREAALLELDCVDLSNGVPEDPVLKDLLQESLLLQLEDTGDQVRTVCRCLAW